MVIKGEGVRQRHPAPRSRREASKGDAARGRAESRGAARRDLFGLTAVFCPVCLIPLVPLMKMKEAVDLCLTGLPPKSILTVCKLFPFYLGTNLTEKRKERREKRSQTSVGGRRLYHGEARFVDLAEAILPNVK